MTDYIKQTEQALYDYLPDLNCREKELIESMKYSLEAGGKRVRPNLVIIKTVCHTDTGNSRYIKGTNQSSLNLV